MDILKCDTNSDHQIRGKNDKKNTEKCRKRQRSPKPENKIFEKPPKNTENGRKRQNAQNRKV